MKMINNLLTACVSALLMATMLCVSPAAAMGTRPSDFSTTPVPASEEAALRAELPALIACVGINNLTTSPGYNDLLTAYNAAFMAVSKTNYARFQAERDIFHTLSAPYKTQYHCS